MVSTLWSCGGTTTTKTSVPSDDSGQLIGWEFDRLAKNRRALFAPDELDKLARDLVEQLARGGSDRPPRVAFYYFTLGGRKHYLGEGIAQDLSTLMVQNAGSKVEVYTRRKLERSLSELKIQMTDLFDSSKLAQIGKLSGVDAIISGRIRKRGAEYSINAQILDVQTSKILGGKIITIPAGKTRTARRLQKLTDVGRSVARDIQEGLDDTSEWRLAIYDISQGKRPFDDGREIAEAIGTELASAPSHVSPLTRSQLDQAIEELKIQGSDLFDESTRAKIGQFVGANVVLTGFAETFNDFYWLNIQVLDVETARIRHGSLRLMSRGRRR